MVIECTQRSFCVLAVYWTQQGSITRHRGALVSGSTTTHGERSCILHVVFTDLRVNDAGVAKPTFALAIASSTRSLITQRTAIHF